jgi:hypothetical protein
MSPPGGVRNKFFRSDYRFQARGMTTMTFITTGITNRTPVKSDKPWIHVRARLLERLWMGLAFFSVDGPLAAWPGEQPRSLANAAGA